MNDPSSRQRGSKDVWLNAAYNMLISNGIDSVKVMALARKLNLTRTGFYWFFDDISELHNAMITRWERQNTGILVDRCQQHASNICEALFNVMDCWLDPALFDAQLDLAIRNWARTNPALETRLKAADEQRIDAITALFVRHGFSTADAQVRGLTIIYTQIGYISMQVEEAVDDRLAKVQHYVQLFAGMRPTQNDVDRFMARHDPVSDAP